MKSKVIPKTKLMQFLKELSVDYNVFVPIKHESSYRFEIFNKQVVNFEDYSNTRIPPKEILFPQTETLFSYDDLPKVFRIEDDTAESDQQITFGVRNCDARSFNILDTFFSSGDYTDPYYFSRRNRTTIVGLACNTPSSSCFCTSVGGDPFSTDGFDARLVELGEKYIFEAVTPRGEEILEKMGKYADPSEEDLKTIMQLAVEKRAFNVNLELAHIEQILDDLYENPMWDEGSRKCLGCGSCSYVCPTCHCFDVNDEKEGSGGRRVRFWDSCQFPLFTLHGSGHNPRISGKERIRQRIFHKFNYYLKNYNLIGCVGCGRCIRACPMNHDVRETLQVVMNKQGA